jgi:hypothetical protein
MKIEKETFVKLANKMLESDDVQIYELNNSVEYSLDWLLVREESHREWDEEVFEYFLEPGTIYK